LTRVARYFRMALSTTQGLSVLKEGAGPIRGVAWRTLET
jgi:hypothetical protein